MLSNTKRVYNVFTVFNKVPLNQCQAVFKILFCLMVYLNRLFEESFVILLHTGLVGEVNSIGDIPCTEMSADLQPDLYEMGNVHDLHVECYNCVFSVLV